MSSPDELKPFPNFKSDDEAERFVAEADLSEYDFSGFKPTHFDFSKGGQLTMRVPQSLLDAVKGRAKAQGVSYKRYIRNLLERDAS